jgi:integrase
MPKYVSHQLTDKQIKNTKPPASGLVTLHDGGGLELRISPADNRTWYHKYYRPITKKRDNKKLGAYPAVSLKVAREMVEENKRLIELGIDPKVNDHLEREKLEKQSRSTLELISREWHQHHVEIKNITEDQAVDILRSLELHVFPKIGKLPISDLTVQLVKDALQPAYSAGKLETIRRVCSRLNMVMKYAVNREYVKHNPIAYVDKEFKKPTVKNQPAIPFEQLPELISKVESAEVSRFVYLCFYLSLHTMVRPANAAHAKWSDFDLDNRTWKIPADSMKMGRDFYIPLSKSVLALLEEAKALYGTGEYLFPHSGQPSAVEPMSSQSVNAMLKRIGYEGIHTSHGNRALGATWLTEKTEYPRDWIKAALAHKDDKEDEAYLRRDYLEHRRDMMEDWSQHIVDVKTKAIAKPSF